MKQEEIENNNPSTHPKHDCNDYRTKVHFNSEKYTGCKCMICDTILEFEWKASTHLLSKQPSGVSEEKIQFLGKRKFKFEFYDMSETSEVVEYDERSLFEVMNGYFQASGGLRYTKFHNCAIISNEAFKLILLDKSLSPQSEAVDVKEFIKFLDKNKIEYCGETFNKDELIFRFPLEKPTADEFYMLLTFTQVLAEFKSLHKTSK